MEERHYDPTSKTLLAALCAAQQGMDSSSPCIFDLSSFSCSWSLSSALTSCLSSHRRNGSPASCRGTRPLRHLCSMFPLSSFVHTLLLGYSASSSAVLSRDQSGHDSPLDCSTLADKRRGLLEGYLRALRKKPLIWASFEVCLFFSLYDLSGKVAIVTGCSAGIGYAASASC